MSTELLPAVLERARQAPFYRDRLPEMRQWNEALWSEIPFTTKEDLRRAYPFGLLALPRSRVATYHESSGTSGEPTPSYFTDADWDEIASRFARSAIGLGPGDTVLVKTPYSLLTTAHQMHRAARLKGALVVPASNRSGLIPYAKVVRLLRDLPTTVAWCMPTEVLLWAEAARLQGSDPARDFPELRAFWVAGEAVSLAKRRRMEAIWGGKPVFDDYGSTETGSLAGQCARGRMHLWSDRLFAEVFDDKTGRTSRSGEGQLIVTPLFREAMPLVRYALEDTVRLDLEECDCGWPWPVVQVLGRTLTQSRVQGKALFPKQLEEAVYGLPQALGVVFWRARHDDQRLHVEIETEASEAASALRREVLHSLDIRAEVIAVAPGTIVSRQLLTEQAKFRKPRFLFAWQENWETAVHY